ncbi:MAG: hypothetical protein M5U12_32965 [Verrucomicrobia bacterium]|nr:hypothetical protein [Verrucomicrobiota bacterium]
MGSLSDYLQQVVIPRYQVVLTYDIGNGLRVERGSDVFGRWNEKTEVVGKAPRPSIELVTYYLRYCANLARLGQNRVRVGVILKDAQFFLGDDTRHPDTHATAFLIREWTRERLLVEHDVVSFLLTENFNELHPLLRQNPLAAHLEVPLPGEAELRDTLRGAQPRHPHALGAAGGRPGGSQPTAHGHLAQRPFQSAQVQGAPEGTTGRGGSGAPEGAVGRAGMPGAH